MVRWIVAGLLFAVAGLCFAQGAVKLTFPASGDRMVWMAAMPPDAEPTGGIAANGTSVDLKTAGKGDAERIFIWDKSTGNLASKAIREIKGPEWPVKAADFTLITRVDVRVEHKGQPVETASVRIQDGRQDISAIIDSTSGGTATFWAVKPGQLKVEVTYRTEGKNADPIKQVFELSLSRKEPTPKLIVSIGDPVPTVENKPIDDGAAPAGTGKGSEGSGNSGSGSDGAAGGDGQIRRTGGSSIGNLIAFLIAVAVAAAFVFFGLRWIKANQAKVQAQLEKMGVEIPGQQEDPQTVVQTPIAPAPPEKIVLSGSDPVPIAASPVAAPLTGIPTLVGSTGQRWEIPDGESVVSREPVEGLMIEGDTSVSRRHAVIIKDAAGVRVRDEGSTNGTFVNGRKIDSETSLQPGDDVQFGMARFKFEG